MKSSIKCLVIACLAAVPLIQAQTGVRFAYESVVDGNAFRNYEKLSDVIQQPRFSIDHQRTGERGSVQFFYNASAFLFSEYSQRQYYYHNAGVTGEYWGASGRQTFSWGLQGGQRVNKDAAYQYYDYQNVNAYLNLRIDHQNGRIFVLGAQARYRHNSHLPVFDFLESLAFVRGSLFLKTRTTVIAMVQGGNKAFTQSSIDEAWVATVTGNGQPGRGKGRGNAGQDTVYTRVVYGESAQEGVFQLTASLRLAQSLGGKTGIAVEALVQRNLSGDSRVLSGQDGGYEANDELFDDPYSYDMEQLSFILTQLLPWQSRIQLQGALGNKTYDRPVYTLEGEAVEDLQRHDRPRLWSVSFSKTFRLAQGLTLSVDYASVDQRSNAAYYRYQASVTRLGCALRF